MAEVLDELLTVIFFIHSFPYGHALINYPFIFSLSKIFQSKLNILNSRVLFFPNKFYNASSHLTGNRCIVDAALCDHR